MINSASAAAPAPTAMRRARRRSAAPLAAAARVIALALIGQVPPACAADAREEVIADFELVRGGDVITIAVNVAGRTYPFVLDSGASTWVFDDALRFLLGAVIERTAVHAAGFSTTTDVYAAPPMRIGPMAVDLRSRAVCAPLRSNLGVCGVDLYGIVPATFLRGKIFRLDFDGGKLRFLSRLPKAAGERFALAWRNDRLYLQADLGDAGQEEFLIDTGCCTLGAGSLRQPLFERLAAAGRMKSLVDGETHYTVFGTTATRDGKIDQFALGPFAHQGLIFNEAEKSNLGIGYLARYSVTFDLTQPAMYLRPARAYARQDCYDLAGLSVARVEGRTIVSEVAEGAPAKAAGLKGSDEILEVDGVAAARTTIVGLSRMFATPGTRTVRFVRGGANQGEREATVVLIGPDALDE